MGAAHVRYVCVKGACSSEGCCPICDGGVFSCSVCGLVEYSLTTECPGVPCFTLMNEDVYAGQADFYRGRWWPTASAHSPAGWRQAGAKLRNPEEDEDE